MKKGMKRLLVWSLCLCMVMGQTVFAEGKDSGSMETVESDRQESESTGQIAERTQNVGKESQADLEKSGAVTETENKAAVRIGGVAVNETNFPDANFRDYVSKQLDTDGDGSLSGDEINAVVKIDVDEKGISSLEGLGYFTSLNTLVCRGNQLTNLDISQNTKLTLLYCGYNQLTSLDVSKNLELTDLSCEENLLTSLDVSNNVKLIDLTCFYNPLSSLDVSKNVELVDLICASNKLTSLDVSNNKKLERLSCPGAPLTSLDISNNTELYFLSVGGLSVTLKKLDVSNNKKLKYLYCSRSQLTDLDVSNNTALVQLLCNDNQLKELDVSKNVNLEWLECEQNQLTSLDVRNCTKLEKLHVRPLPKSKVQYTKEPAEFLYGTETDQDTSGITTNTNPSEVKADIAEVVLDKIFVAFHIDPQNANAKVIVTQKEAGKKDKDYLTNLASQSGNTVLKVYDVVMDLYVNGQHKGNVTDNFGNLKLTFYVGTEYAGRKAIIYQLHGDEVILHKNKPIKKDGTVTITVPKLSTFAVALQDTSDTAANKIRNRSPQTGDSTDIAFWLLSAVLAMSVLVTIAAKRKKG